MAKPKNRNTKINKSPRLKGFDYKEVKRYKEVISLSLYKTHKYGIKSLKR